MTNEGCCCPRHISKCKTRVINSSPSDVEQVCGVHPVFPVVMETSEKRKCVLRLECSMKMERIC